jgi:hypothetical protein
VPRPAAATFATDLLRASLGPALSAPYERAFGPVPWLTAGTLAWPAAAGDDVLGAWSAWASALPPSVLTAVRVGEAEVAVDVAVLGDPCSAPSLLAPLRTAGPHADTVRSLGVRAFRAPCALASAAVALPAVPHAGELCNVPAGVCLGLRRAPDGPVLIGIAAAAERPRAVAAIDQVARWLEEPVASS